MLSLINIDQGVGDRFINITIKLKTVTAQIL